MSSQQRYRTLVHHIGRIYAAPDGTRTELLQTGLDQIVSVVGPTNTATWNMVGADSDRLLKIWVAKEKDDAAATVAQQIGDLLRELADSPVVEIIPSLTVADVVSHVPEPVVIASPEPEAKKPVPELKKPEPEAKKPVPELKKPEPEVKKPVPELKKPEPEAEEEEYEVEEEEDGSKPPSDDEGEVLEPEADANDEDEEEEEVGMEVEQITIRGRTWWLEVNTQKIYAVVDGDDVGDEMGEMVAGKPRFYNK
jgi:hypothetical protein